MAFFRTKPEFEFKRVMLDYPDCGRPFSLLHEAVMRASSPFTPGERELLAAYASSFNECGICIGEHGALATAFGLRSDALDKLRADVDSAPVDDRLKPVFHFVRKLTLTPSAMTQADADAIFATGWDDHALYYAVMVCALFNMDNRIAQGLGIPPHGPAALAATVTRLHRDGYKSAAALIDAQQTVKTEP